MRTTAEDMPSRLSTLIDILHHSHRSGISHHGPTPTNRVVLERESGSRRCISQGHGGLHERVAREPSVSLFAARLITSGKGEQYQSEGRIRPALPRTSNTNTKTLPSRLRIPLFVQTLGGRSGTSVPLPDVKPPETGLRSLPGPF